MFRWDNVKRLGGTSLMMAPVVALLMAGGSIAATSDSRLADAARTQDQKKVRALASQGVDINGQSDDGSTALLWATHWNDLDTTDFLIRAGADANIANEYRMTALSRACTNGNASLVRLLLKAGANPDTPIATDETPLMTCAKTGNLEAVRALLEAGANVNAKESTQRQTAIMWAAAERHADVVKALADAHADLQAHSKQGFTVLHFAARVGDEESVKILLAVGMDINTRTQLEGVDPKKTPVSGPGSIALQLGLGTTKTVGTIGYTPLLIATVRGQVGLALFLLDHGADPNILDAGYTPLHWASSEWESYTANPVYGIDDPMAGIPNRQDKLRLVKALFAHGANVNARMTKPQPTFAGGYLDCVGATPFLLASSANDLEMMRVLLAAGADPKIGTESKANAIMAAAGLNHFIGENTVTESQAMETVKFLLDRGVEPKGETTFGENALFGPAYRGWNTLLAQLIDLGVNVNAVSKAGVTPWRAAAGQGDRLGGVLYNKDGADLLQKHGADPTLGRACEAQNKCRELGSAERE